MKSFFALIIVLFIAKTAFTQQPEQQQPLKLVVGIVVENMRPDYVHRYWDKFGENGFKKIYNNGAVCTNVKLSQHVQSYASGTATLFTGTYSSTHGIANKTWYDRMKKNETDCTSDNNFNTLGSNTKAASASPVKLLANTITDILRVYSRGQSKVYSAALNRESAIFSAGHAANCAYWFDAESGRMVTSSFYINALPDWVVDFNAENYAEIYSYRTWALQLAEADYTESLRDDYIYEKGYFNEFKTFPHTISKYIKRTNNYMPFKTTPSANLMIKDFVLKMIDNEKIGENGNTDFLTAVFSSMDYENISFGPASLEMEDTYLCLDKYIGELIDSIENKVGKNNVVFFLTANTSASYPIEYLKEEFHLPVDYFNVESAMALLTSFLNITYGEEEWIEYNSELEVYLNHKAIKNRNLKINEIRDAASNFINQFEGVLVAMPAYQLELGNSTEGMLKPLFRSYTKNRSGDFLFMLKEGWQPAYKYKKINFTDHSHIPLVFFGRGIKPQIIKENYDAIDIVPTLSEIMQIPSPDKSQGKIIGNL